MADPEELWRGGSAGRQAALPAPLRDLHRAILRRFLQAGAPPASPSSTSGKSWTSGTTASRRVSTSPA